MSFHIFYTQIHVLYEDVLFWTVVCYLFGHNSNEHDSTEQKVLKSLINVDICRWTQWLQKKISLWIMDLVSIFLLECNLYTVKCT